MDIFYSEGIKGQTEMAPAYQSMRERVSPVDAEET